MRRAIPDPVRLLEAIGRPLVAGIDWVLTALGLAARALAAAPDLVRAPMRQEFQRSLRLAMQGSLAHVALFSLLLGMTLIGQALYWLTLAGQSGLVRTLMVDALTREAAPVLVAMVLLARVGTGTLIELAAVRTGPAWRGLHGQGIDPFRLLAAPRAFATAAAGLAHTVIAVAIASLGGHLTALALGASTLRPVHFLASVLDGMYIQDFLLVALKGPVLGFTATFCTAIVALASVELAREPAKLVQRGLALGATSVIAVSLLLSTLL
ncbi:MAG: ABC transporter permease [Acetobacteraceae bacterium]|nr:ABC transporter permease [Acetobacteraceae bacterium]